MSMVDSFFKQAFKASKCKTLLKLTIPRIKLLRNRREIQLKQMRREIAKLLETGQEATARIRVEHIIREENMMAAQEIVELFCELIVVRLPIIESQRECPLDLKEAISSVCFAAPRCSDLPELLQVQLLFASKYGKEFVSAASELVPDCGVNRQLIELLSIRAPSPEKKLKLLKDIAVEHELDWDPSASETEFLKKHEDLLDGPTKFVGGSKLALPEEKHNEALYTAPDQPNKEQPDSDSGADTLEFPEVPKVSVQPCSNSATAPKMVIPPATPPSEVDLHSSSHSRFTANVKQEQVEERSIGEKDELHTSSEHMENRQFVPFISPPFSPPLVSSRSPFVREIGSPPSLSKTSEADVDLQDVLAAAHAAAETAEHAAAAARSAASLAQERISELTKKNRNRLPDSSCENPFFTDTASQSESRGSEHVTEQIPTGNSDGVLNHFKSHPDHNTPQRSDSPSFPSSDTLKADFDSSLPNDHVLDNKSSDHRPKRLPSMDDDSYFSYPNLFTSQNSNVGSQTHSDNISSTHDL